MKVVQSHVSDCKFYVLPVVPPYDKRTEYRSKTYQVCARVRDDQTGKRSEQVVEREYPSTPESVKSYAEAADYRRDPVTAAMTAKPRTNLGDIRGMQDVSKMDTAQLNALQQRYHAAMAEVEKVRAAKVQAQAQVQDQAPAGEVK